ncbi:hypothetical protein BDD12DRAFT_896710 [Trichophaea hybrida]|nr:hypothetical protein BDD12DRAFT_896710 [Trichophaea hybrida]
MDRPEILAAWQDFLREKGLSQGKFAQNVDPALLQSSSTASASRSAMYPPPTNVLNTEPAPPNTNAAPPITPSSSTATSAPPPSRPTAPKQRLTQSSFPFHASTASNPGTRATVVKRAKPLCKDRPRMCRLLGISNDDQTVINDYRDWIENDCIRRGKPLNIPYTSRTDTENYELARSVINKWNRQYGDKKTLSEDIIGALIHRISLDNVRNVATKAKRRMAKANGKRASPIDNEDVSHAPPVSKMPKNGHANHTPPLTNTPANAGPTIAAAVATPTTTTLVAAPSSVPPPLNEELFPIPPVVSPPPIVAAPQVVATPAVGNSTPETTPERGQVIGFSSSGDNIQTFIGPSSESFGITRAHSNVQLLGMIQGRLPFVEDDILMISTDRATTSWKALDSEVWVRVRDNNDTAKVYFKVAGQEERESGTEDEEEFQIDPNATLQHKFILSPLTTPTKMNYMSSTLSNEDSSKATNDINITADDGRPPAQEASNISVVSNPDANVCTYVHFQPASGLDDSDFSLKLPKMDPPKWIVNRRRKGQARGRANGRSNIQYEIPSDGTGLNHGDSLDTTGNPLETSRTAVETSGTPVDTSGIAVETFGTVNTSGTPVETSGTLVETFGTVYTSGTPVVTSGIPVETFGTVDTSGTPVETSETSAEPSATSVETSGTPAETTGTPLETTGMPPDSCETSSDFTQLESTGESQVVYVQQVVLPPSINPIEALAVGHLVEQPIMRLAPRRS